MGKGYSKSYKSSTKTAAKRAAKQQAAAEYAASLQQHTVSPGAAAAGGLPAGSSSVAKETCEMMLRLGSLVHQLQKERGSSSIFAGSDGTEYGSELQLLRVMVDKSMEELAGFCQSAAGASGPERRPIHDYLQQLQRTDFSQLKTPSPYNMPPQTSALEAQPTRGASQTPQELFSHIRQVLAELRQNIDSGALRDYAAVTKRYAAMVDALSMVIVNLQGDFQHLALGPAIAAYVSLMHLKESVGMERAIVGGMLAGKTERFTVTSYSDLLINHGLQAAYAKAFRLNTPRAVLVKYRELCEPQSAEGIQLDGALLNYKQAGVARPLHECMPGLSSKGWFDLMTNRLDNFVVIESLLANHILELGMTEELSVSPDSLTLMDEGSYHGANTDIGLHLSNSDVIDVRELDVKQEIGRGTTGSTYLSLWRSTKVAVKVIQVQKSTVDNELLLRDFGREVSVLKKAHHPNICQFLGCAIDPPTYCVVLEFMQGGSLFEALRKRTQEINFFSIAADVACGMEFLHTRMQLMHRDLKSPNILMDSQQAGRAKLADFGLTCLEQPEGEKTAEIGTYRWMAPEVINHEEYGKPADVYSYGMVLYELLTRELPFVGISPMKVAMSVATTGLRPKLPSDTPPQLAELITRCWARDPLKRPTFAVVQQQLQTMQSGMRAEEKALIREIGFRASHFVRQPRDSNGGANSGGALGDGTGSKEKERSNGSGSHNSQFDALAHNPVAAMQQKANEGDGAQPMDTERAPGASY